MQLQMTNRPTSLFVHVTQKELEQVLSLREQVNLQLSDPERRENMFVSYMVHFLGLEKEWIPRLLDPEECWQLICDNDREALHRRVSTVH